MKWLMNDGSIFQVEDNEPAESCETEVVVIDKEKWGRLVELLTADLPWERHEIRDLIEEVNK